MTTLTIDGKSIDVPAGTTVLDAAKALGIEIPTLCHCPGKPAQTSCLVCVVKVDGGARLMPSCAITVRDGMQVESSSPEVTASRRTALELLLANHLGDCLAPCESVCPLQQDIPSMLAHAARWETERALAVIRPENPLPATLGRLCHAPCEKGCRRERADDSVAMAQVEAFVADQDLASASPHLPPCAAPSGRRVAIVGAGPAGLSAAWKLRQLGHDCTIFDARDRAGGTLLDLPAEKLPPAALAAEVAQLRRLGVEFRLGKRVGSFEQLRDGHAAVLIAGGKLTAELAAAFGLPFAGDGLVAEKDSFRTPVEGAFACGSAMKPEAQLVKAVASGRMAALAIDRWLAGKKSGLKKPWSVRTGRLPEGMLDAAVACYGEAKRGERDRSALNPDQAHDQADRCLRCACTSRGTCTLKRWSEEYGCDANRWRMELPHWVVDDTHPEVVYEPGKCIACGLCVLVAKEHGEGIGLGFISRGLTVRVVPPFGLTFRDALVRSGRACAAVCPTGAIALKPGLQA